MATASEIFSAAGRCKHGLGRHCYSCAKENDPTPQRGAVAQGISTCYRIGGVPLSEYPAWANQKVAGSDRRSVIRDMIPEESWTAQQHIEAAEKHLTEARKILSRLK